MDAAASFGRIPWVAALAPSLAGRLLAAGRRVELGAGQWVYGEGDPETGLCAILAGSIRLEVTVGAEASVLIGMAQAPGILGRTHRQGGGGRILTARAGPPSIVLQISDAALERIAAGEPALWRAVNTLVYGQLDAAVHLTAQLLILGPRARIAARLRQLAAPDGAVPLSQGDLAELCGLSRKAVNAHLSRFEAAGLLRRGYGEIRILDVEGLGRLARRRRASTGRS